MLEQFYSILTSWHLSAQTFIMIFFFFKCEKIIEELGGKKSSQKSNWLSDEHEEDDDEEGLKIKMKLKEATKQVNALCFLTSWLFSYQQAPN